MNIRVRRAMPADAEAIQRIHSDTWLTAYREIIPDSHLEKLVHDHRFSFWLDSLGHPDGSTFIYVAQDSTDRIVGFAAAGPSRAAHLPYEMELYAIYVLPGQQGAGVGRSLLNEVARELLSRGVKSMLLYVLKDNPSRRFYERLGGQLLEERQVEIDGETFADVVYGWRDIAPLIQGSL